MTKSFVRKPIRRVAVIGGGPGGIAAARALDREGVYDTITIYERNAQLGGTWIYDPKRDPSPALPSTDALEVDYTLKVDKLHSPIYASLHANLPKHIMCYRDVPFDANVPLFAKHQDILGYLKTVSKELLPMVNFETRVERIDQRNDQWVVMATDLKTGKQFENEFDAVTIATGHYNVPYIPDIPGIDRLKPNIQVVHSRDYRTPEEFKDKTVLVIGGGHSGSDILRETSTVARKVYLSTGSENELTRQALEAITSRVEQVGLLSFSAVSKRKSNPNWTESA